MNFLQVSEPEAASLDAQSDTAANNERLKNQAATALVAQYGPAAADPEMQSAAIAANTAQQTQDSTVAAENAKNQDVPQQIAREAQLRAAYALKSAMDSGVDGGTAWDTIVGPNSAAWGIDPAHAATMRQHLSQDPKQVSMASVNALISGLTGPAKPLTGADLQRYTNKTSGETIQGYTDDQNQFHQVNTPAGYEPAGPTSLMGIAGSLKPVYDAKTDTWSQQGTTKSGQFVRVPYQGTPTAGMNSFAAATRAGVAVNNSEYGVDTGTVGGITGAPGGIPAAGAGNIAQAIIGQESRGNPNSPTSVNGAVGIGQITPSFVKTFARPGENPNNPADNLAIAQRGIAYYQQQYKDPARVAVAYFSGPGNVAPPGSPTPWIKDAHDGNGTKTSTYVQQVLGRMGGAAPAAGQAPGTGGAVPFANLPPKGRQMALDSARGIVNGAQQLSSIDSQIDNISKQVGPMSIGLGSMTAGIPGSPASNLQSALSTLRAQGLTSWLNSLKNASGSTGIGRVLQSEATAAQNSFGALEQSQSEDQFRYHLGIFQQRVHQLQTNAEQAYKQQYGTDAYSAMGMPSGATGGPNAHLSDQQLLAKYGVH